MRTKHTKRLHTASTKLTPTEYRELQRYARGEDVTISDAMRDLLVPMISARAQMEQGHGLGDR